MPDADASPSSPLQSCYTGSTYPLSIDDLDAERDAFEDAAEDGPPPPPGVQVPLDFEPNALLWCPEREALLLADDTNGQVLSFTEGRGFSVIARIGGED